MRCEYCKTTSGEFQPFPMTDQYKTDATSGMVFCPVCWREVTIYYVVNDNFYGPGKYVAQITLPKRKGKAVSQIHKPSRIEVQPPASHWRS
jgi:hypothetical protein